jgi:hypothetical protein
MRRALLLVLVAACGGSQKPAAESAPIPENHPTSPSEEPPGTDQPPPPEPGEIAAPADVAGPPPNATVTGSGLAYLVLRAGQGARPGATDTVTVHYTGWTTDGRMFDSSRTRGAPASFPLNAVIAGWSEAVQLMSVGGQLRCWIPDYLAYKGRPGAPQGTLVFDIELLAIQP